MDMLRKSFDLFSANDFNVEFNQTSMTACCDSHSVKSLVKEPTCFENPSLIDLMLTNLPNSFQNSCAIETGLSDFHKMNASFMKIKLEKLQTRIVHYRNYLISKLSMENIGPADYGLEKFLVIWVGALDRFVPRKKKIDQGNNMPLVNGNLKKAHMKRNRLQN